MASDQLTKFKETEIGLIPAEWKVLPIYDLAQWINGLAFKNIHFTSEGRPVIKINELKYGITDQTQFTQDVFDEDYLLKKKDLLFSWSGSPDTSIDAFWYSLLDGWLNQHIFRIKPKSEVTKDFLYYILKANKQRFIDIARDKQTTGLGHVTIGDLKRFVVALPELDEQQRIAPILSCLDDKIELNRKINANLEKLAATLFKKWFVDIGDELPEGWRMEKIVNLKLLVTDYVANGSFATLKENVSKIYEEENYALFVRNTDLKNKFSTKRYVDKKAYDFLSKTHLNGGEVIISNVADVGSVYKCPRSKMPMVLGNNVIMLNGKLLNNYLYLYFSSQVGQSAIRSITSGSAQLKFNKTDFRNLKIIIPTDDILEEFDGICEGIFQMVQNNEDEINNLSVIRDSLLPRLMSGKIRVNI